MKEIQQLQKQLTSAKALESRRLREYHAKGGAVIGFDYESNAHAYGEDEAKARLAKAREEEAKAGERYSQAREKRLDIENKIKKKRPKQRRSANAPLF